MKAARNSTVINGVLRTCTPAADGYGHHLDIEVASNVSPDPGADFVKPAPGTVLQAFAAPAPSLENVQALVGSDVRVTLTFLGGPSGGQAVVQAITAI